MRRSRIIAAILGLGLIAGGSQAQSRGETLAETLDGKLVHLRAGRLVPTAPSADARYVAFYFGASWCGPCRAFVPELRDAYSELQADGVEIVFVSDDTGCRPMQDYMVSSRMPWPALACHERQRLAGLQATRGKALPGLLVYEADGTLVASSWSPDGNSSPRRTLATLNRLVTD